MSKVERECRFEMLMAWLAWEHYDVPTPAIMGYALAIGLMFGDWPQAVREGEGDERY